MATWLLIALVAWSVTLQTIEFVGKRRKPRRRKSAASLYFDPMAAVIEAETSVEAAWPVEEGEDEDGEQVG